MVRVIALWASAGFARIPSWAFREIEVANGVRAASEETAFRADAHREMPLRRRAWQPPTRGSFYP